MQGYEEFGIIPKNLVELKLAIKDFSELKRPQLEEYKFNFDAFEYKLPKVELKSRYIYSYGEEALQAAKEELKEKVYSKLKVVIASFAKSYEENELAPLLKSEEKAGNYYYDVKNELSKKLKFYVYSLDKLTGEKHEIKEDFFEFKTELNLACLKEVLSSRYEIFAEDVFESLPKVDDYADDVITVCDRIKLSNKQQNKENKEVEETNLFKPLEEEGKQFSLFEGIENEEKEALEEDIIERWGYDLTAVIKLLKADLLTECSDYLLDYAEELIENLVGCFEDDLHEEYLEKGHFLLELIEQNISKENKRKA